MREWLVAALDDRVRLSRLVRETFLSEEALADGYGVEDVADFWGWLRDLSMGHGVDTLSRDTSY